MINQRVISGDTCIDEGFCPVKRGETTRDQEEKQNQTEKMSTMTAMEIDSQGCSSIKR
jgi:hypothetical protein